MLKLVTNLILFFATSVALCQTFISGKVVNEKGNPISGANEYLEGIYDGASTNAEEIFSFETNEKGIHTLVVSFLNNLSIP